MTKFLILRFSSIGDIVLTTPVVRCLKMQYPEAEIHYATKKSFHMLLANNPYIDKIHLLDKNLWALICELRKENFHYVIDLHHNLRTSIIKASLLKKAFAFDKLNINKFLLTQFKINRLPDIHIVDRYMETIKSFNINNDQKGLDYFIPKKDEISLNDFGIQKPFLALVIGAKFATKRLTQFQLEELCGLLTQQVVLLGGKEDELAGKQIANKYKHVINLSGLLNLNQSADVLKQAEIVVTHDTGLMHIAAALQKSVISIWGNTVPAFGMYPYLIKDKFKIIEVADLACRPCTKIGYGVCPKQHFKCIKDIEEQDILEQIESLKAKMIA